MRFHNREELKDLRRSLRNDATKAEVQLWQTLRGAKLDGRKFRRQHSIGPYIADFFCPEERLVIEIDGPIHNEPEVIEHDRIRTEYLNAHGYKVLRFSNDQALVDQYWMLEQIRATWKGRERTALPKNEPGSRSRKTRGSL